jgi:hypothetical protein
MLVYLAYSLILKMEVLCPSSTLGSLWTTRSYDPEDQALHSNKHENPKSNIKIKKFQTANKLRLHDTETGNEIFFYPVVSIQQILYL